MFSLFDAGIVCHLKERMGWSSSGLHSSGMKIVRAQFPKNSLSAKRENLSRRGLG